MKKRAVAHLVPFIEEEQAENPDAGSRRARTRS